MTLGAQTPNIAGGQTTPGGGSYTTIVSVYGTNASNSVSYGIASIATSSVVALSTWTDLVNKVNAERNRRGYGSLGITLANPINSTHLNSLINNVNVTGPAASQAYNTNNSLAITTYPQAPVPPSLPATVTSGTKITASTINALISSINSAGAVCTCNCNYCTCNCNYCTCNCNYSCTCNCNYSDERLKRNIEFVESKAGVNIYTWSYVWDKATKYIGVLAQELIGTQFQDALSKDNNGYYMVDYAKLPVNMIQG